MALFDGSKSRTSLTQAGMMFNNENDILLTCALATHTTQEGETTLQYAGIAAGYLSKMFISIFIIALLISFISCSDDENNVVDTDNFHTYGIYTYNSELISDTNPHLISTYNTREQYGAWYGNFLRMIVNDSSNTYLIKTDDNTINVNETINEIANVAADYYSFLTGETIELK
jgi:hypothetical protein